MKGFNYFATATQNQSPEENKIYVGEILPIPVGIPKNIETAINACRRKFYNNQKLLNDYKDLYFRDKKRIQEKVADSLVPSSLSYVVDEYAAAVTGIKECKPTDVIRSLFYATQNDSAIECSYIFDSFCKNFMKPQGKYIIFNASPDFTIKWTNACHQNCHTIFVVSDLTVIRLYSWEFHKRVRFVEKDFVMKTGFSFDAALIIGRGLSENVLYNYIEIASKITSNILTLTSAKNVNDDFSKLLSQINFKLESLLYLPAEVTQSLPRKKFLFHLVHKNVQNSKQVHCYRSMFEGISLYIEKKCRVFTEQEVCNQHQSISELFDKYDKIHKGLEPLPQRTPPSQYAFSKEITIYYSWHKENDRYAAKACYRDPNKKPGNKYGERLSPIIEKGLRGKSIEELMDKLETCVFTNELSNPIISQLQKYNLKDAISISLKTVWFWCRSKLRISAGYNDEFAKQVFFKRNDLTDMDIFNFNQTIADNAILEMANKNKDFWVQKYWKLLEQIYKAATSLKIIDSNPITNILSYYSNKATVYQNRIRSALVHSTLDEYEEKLFLKQLCIKTSAPFGDRNAYLYETDSLAMLTLFRFFTGLSIRECCALSWEDIKYDQDLDFYKVFVSKYIKDNKTITKYISEQNLKKLRYVPIAKQIAIMMETRKNYVCKTYGIPNDIINTLPIFTNDNALPQYCKKSELILTPKFVTQKTRHFFDALKRQEFKIILPSENEHKDDLETDLFRYYGDIVYSNFKAKVIDIAGFDKGEQCYCLGCNMPDTYNAHYCDFQNDLVQYKMASKLLRWTSKYSCLNRIGESSNNDNIYIPTHENPVSLHIQLEPSNDITEIKIKCEYGFEGTITTIKEQG